MFIIRHLLASLPNQRSTYTLNETLIQVALLFISLNTEDTFDVSTFSVQRKQRAENENEMEPRQSPKSNHYLPTRLI